MRSTSASQVGTDPDLNTVNVTNRVNQALAQLPPEVQRNGVTTKKQSTRAAAGRRRLLAQGQPRRAVPVELRDDQHARHAEAGARRRRCRACSAPLEYSMRIWLNLDRMASLDITPRTWSTRSNAQNIQAAVGRVGAAPLVDEVGFQLNITHPGPADHGRGVREHRRARHARWRAGAHQGHRPRRARRQDQRFDRPLQRQAGGRHRDLPVARRQCARHRRRACARR